MREFAVVYERAPNNWCAYVPDLPGCITTGKTLEETQANIREAIELHIEGMIEDGTPVPEPTTQVGTVAVAA
jgi:predicted RNase H-like HicB family nuclease